ncbi:MAG: serine--tRNA ligase, partial [bacterium]|nr:serine--tRNA ligase [bacterium]
WGEPKTFDFKVKDHVDIGNSLDILDIDRAGKVTGARFAYLKNEAVLLQFALVNFVFSTLTNKDIVSKIAKQVGSNSDKVFSPNLPPVFIKAEVMKKMDRFEPVEDRFYFEKDELVLVGSAEHTMGSYFMDEVIDEKDLPIRFVGYSTVFRREAGSYGKDTRGILRVHQFDKLEMECFTTVDEGKSEQDLLVGIQEYLMQQLQLPYQVVDVCIGDTGRPDYRQYDIETWIPSQDKYRETHSADYMTDFQSRRLNTRYKSRNGESKFVYMNDATAFALGRTLIAILENYQQEDGSVLVPEVLQKYTGFTKIEPKK